jgi:hypothetical protein
MKKSISVLIVLTVLLGLQACKEKDPGPDLTSELVGQYEATYTLVPQVPEPYTPPLNQNATLTIRRRTNSLIWLTVTIKDGDYQFEREFGGTIEAGAPVSPGEPIRRRFGLEYTELEAGTRGKTGILLYKNGTIMTGLQLMDNEKKYFVNVYVGL